MKRIAAWLLLLALCLLQAGCGNLETPIQPFRFYYLNTDSNLSSDESMIGYETRDLGSKHYSNVELFHLYMKGPISKNLSSPFSKDEKLVGVYRVGNTLEVQLSEELGGPSELKSALIFACMTKTALELDGIRKVHIQISGVNETKLYDVTLTQGDLLLYDPGELPESMELTLYYADKSKTLLLPEKRQIPIQSAASLPQTLMNLLLSTPETAGLRSPLPSGTALLDLNVENGLCTVDFNGDFFNNRPSTEQSEQLAILSVVNTLCQLDTINQVMIYVEGSPLNPYIYLNLSVPWVSDGSVIGPIREEQGEFLGTLYLPGQDDKLLHQLQVRSAVRGGGTKELALLLSLLDRSSQNGLQTPLSGVDPPLSCQTEQGVCRITFTPHQLPAENAERELCLRCICATLCSLPTVNAVEISEGSSLLTKEPLQPRADWFITVPFFAKED